MNKEQSLSCPECLEEISEGKVKELAKKQVNDPMYRSYLKQEAKTKLVPFNCPYCGAELKVEINANDKDVFD